jgi:hypothetical protein
VYAFQRRFRWGDPLRSGESNEGDEDTSIAGTPWSSSTLRRLAVMLDKQTNRGAVIPADHFEQMVEGDEKQRLQAWLAAPASPFYVMHIAGSCK